ncbi:MAG: hypothetical protein ACYCV5_13540 [Acidimicrobiales bacterium]
MVHQLMGAERSEDLDDAGCGWPRARTTLRVERQLGNTGITHRAAQLAFDQGVHEDGDVAEERERCSTTRGAGFWLSIV